MHVTIVGLGLIGGSIARSLRAAPAADGWAIDGWSPSERTQMAALESGAVDRIVALADAAADTDLLVLAAPPLACLELLAELGGPLRGRLAADVTITDVASTKAAIVDRAESLRLPFVGGHPMAGRETSGFGAAEAGLFADRPWVIVPGRGTGEVDAGRVRALATACGARPLTMDARAHDAAVAGVSHLPLVVSAALVESVSGIDGGAAAAEWPVAASLAAGAWRDMTRVARGDPAMGAGILATNGRAVGERLRRFRSSLDKWIALVEADGGPDPAALESRFDAARACLVDQPVEAKT